MTTTTPRGAAASRPRPKARSVLVVGLASLLVLMATVMVRDGSATTTTSDMERIEEAVRLGCDRPAATLADGTGFALDGTVTDVLASPDRGPLRVTLAVREWLLGPPLDQVELWVDRTTVRYLRGEGGVEVEPGTRLLVSGRGWQSGGDLLAAAGCGRTRAYDDETAKDWRAVLVDRPAAPVGPAAAYAGVGYVNADPGMEPDLRGVLVQDSGCLYLQDGLTRWLPVFPEDRTVWTSGPPRLELAGVSTDVGHAVRLSGVAAGGVVPRGPGRFDEADVVAGAVDPAGVPEGCDDTSPRFVVAEPPAGARGGVRALAADDPVLLHAVASVRRAGLRPTTAAGEAGTDHFGAQSWRLAVATEGGGEVLVHVETVAFLAWPHAYTPRDAGFRWSLNPEHAAGLPPVPLGAQLAVVDRTDGMTQVLWRTAGRVVVSVSADLLTTGPAADGSASEREATDALVRVAREVALSPGGDGS